MNCINIPIDLIKRNPSQPRKKFNESTLNELAQSIKNIGIIEPIIVKKINENTYEIIAGERRWRACALAGLTDVPCLIHEYDDAHAALASLIENIQRENLNVLEQAQAYDALMQQFNYSQEMLAKLVGQSRSHVANLLRLNHLNPQVKPYLLDGVLTLGHARMLVGLSDSQQLAFALKVKKNQWSVRLLEKKVNDFKQSTSVKSSKSTPHDAQISHIAQQCEELLGTPVELTYLPNQSGYLNIRFFDDDTLQGILEKIGVKNS